MPQVQTPSRQAPTVAVPKRWPLVGVLSNRTSAVPPDKDARLINCYAEHDPENNTYDIYKRLGLGSTPFVNEPGLVGLGLYTYNGAQDSPQILTVVGTTLYATVIVGFPVTRLVTAAVGTVNASAPYYFETMNSSPQAVVLQNGVAAYYYKPSGTVFGSLSSEPNFPANTVPGWAYLDGTLYVMDSAGNIWGSGINSLAAWTVLNVIQASSQADAGIALAKQLAYVVAFKQWTTQIFYDAGNPPPGSPLSLIPEAQVPYGCLNGASVQSIDSILLWVTYNQSNSPQVALMENLSAKIISTPAVDRILTLATFTSFTSAPEIMIGILSWSVKVAGHRFYGITLQALNITLVYDIDQKLWYIWTDVNGNYWPVSNIAYMPSYQLGVTNPFNPGMILAQSWYDGVVRPLDGCYTYPTDYGNVFPVDIYTPNFDAGTARRKTLNMLWVSADQQVGSILQSRYSDDDYQTWSEFRDIDLSSDMPMSDREGTFRKRAYDFRHQLPTALKISSVDLQLDIGTL